MARVCCEIPRIDDVSLGALCRPVSFTHALLTMEALRKETDLQIISETVERVIAYLSQKKTLERLNAFLEKQSLVAAIAEYDNPNKYPEALQKKVNAFLFTIQV